MSRQLVPGGAPREQVAGGAGHPVSTAGASARGRLPQAAAEYPTIRESARPRGTA